MMETGDHHPARHDWLDGESAAGERAPRRFARYSRFVEVMKVALPLTALGLVIVIVGYSATHKSIRDMTFTLAELVRMGSEFEMANPTLTYTDEDQRSYVIRAATATQLGRDRENWKLKTIRARMTPPDGGGYDLVSDEGRLDVGGKVLDLTGNVVVTADEGYTFEARSAHTNLDTGDVTSEEPVRARNATTTIDADRFRMWERGAKVRFEGRVKFVSQPAKRAEPG